MFAFTFALTSFDRHGSRSFFPDTFVRRGKKSISTSAASVRGAHPTTGETCRTCSEATGGIDFALAGGAALISQGLVERRTNDLDFFGSFEAALAERLPRVVASPQISTATWVSRPWLLELIIHLGG
jgi:hypothetical protein